MTWVFVTSKRDFASWTSATRAADERTSGGAEGRGEPGWGDGERDSPRPRGELAGEEVEERIGEVGEIGRSGSLELLKVRGIVPSSLYPLSPGRSAAQRFRSRGELDEDRTIDVRDQRRSQMSTTSCSMNVPDCPSRRLLFFRSTCPRRWP